MGDRCDALVIGAGPAGSATALRLAAAGYQVVLADKQDFPRDKCCSEYASPQTLRELDDLGALSSLDTHNWTALDGTVVHGPNDAALYGRFADADVRPFRNTGMALPRRELDATLHQAAIRAGAEARTARLTTLQRHSNGLMEATLDGSEREQRIVARVVVGADGLGSRVARLRHLHRQGGLRRVAFVAHVADVAGMQEHAELHVGRHGYVGLNPIDGTRTNVAVVVPAADAAAARGDVTRFFRDTLARFPSVASRVEAGRIVRGVMACGPFDARCRSATCDGVALVGDAADFFDPFTGEGICSALAGARLLTDTLVPVLATSAPVSHRALAPYRRARRKHFLGKWIVERTIGHAMRWPGLFDHAVDRIARSDLSATVIGITGDFVPASRLLAPRTVWRLIRASGTRQEPGDPQVSRLMSHV